MEDAKETVEQVIKDSERIGSIGSPSSSSELCLDVLESAINKKLVGELSLFSFSQDGFPHYAMGQITEIELQNVWLQDPTIRSLARRRGNVSQVSEKQDTHTARMAISAVFQEVSEGKYRPSYLGTVPATGTPIAIVTDPILDSLLKSQKSELFYLGKVFGSKPKLPLWFKHFGTGSKGAGEAYHMGIFGKTGSGKSVLAKMILTAYARHPGMGIFIIDPQGEFSKDFSGKLTGGMKLPLPEIMKALNRPVIVVKVRNLVLDTWLLFETILNESSFFEKLSMPKGENRATACNLLSEELQKKKITLKGLTNKTAFDFVWDKLGDEKFQTLFYRSPASRERFQTIFKAADKDTFYNNLWLPVANLFNPEREDGKTIYEVVATAVGSSAERPLVVVDLSEEDTTKVQDEDAAGKKDTSKIIWNDSIKALVIKSFLNKIQVMAESLFKEDSLLNTLVVIDEAHRLAPSGDIENEEFAAVRDSLVDAARTTRKYGLGWMFISQTLASLDKEIWGQLGVYFFGFGLSAGSEYRTLQEVVGGDITSLKLYKSFRHPQSSFDASSKEYPFMTVGPVSPLSFSGTPLFLSAYTTINEFLAANNIKI